MLARASAARGSGKAYTPQLMAGKAMVARPSLFASSRQLLRDTSRSAEAQDHTLHAASMGHACLGGSAHGHCQ